jgi:polysaccharide deacetylase family protein (PEP-CTERM system associated)
VTPATPGRDGGPIVNAMTVDVEDYFQVSAFDAVLPRSRWEAMESRVVGNTERLLSIFGEHRVRATFFVLGWVAERYPELVGEILAAGHDVGSHGHLHTRVYELEPGSFRDELRRSVTALNAAGATGVCAFRAPEWSINNRSMWALDVLAAEGFTIDASMAPVKLVGDVTYPRHPHARATSSGPILEVPPFVADRFGQAMPLGWGWGLRMSSPTTVLRSIEQANRAGVPSILTVHPWEIDPDPPKVSLPLRLRFAHYFRLEGFRTRLSAILRDGDFGAVGDLDAVREA